MMPKTLFSRTALTISSLLLIFVLLASGVIFYYIMTPMARQSASHLASFVALSAQTWVELPPETRQDFEVELKKQHGIVLRSQKKKFQPLTVNTPFFSYFKEELQQHLGANVEVLEEFKPEFWIWVKVPIASRILYIGFSHRIIGPNPPLVLFILLSIGAILVIISSLFLVSYLVRPINNLLIATKQLGHGSSPQAIIESGPQELVELTRSFNMMNTQIQELLQNRTILLAGISHDLRTPIARTNLAIEMLNEKQDQSLIQSIKNDLQQMNQLIQRTLDFSKGLDIASEEYQSIELGSYIKNYIQSHPYSSLIILKTNNKKQNTNFSVSLPVSVLERIFNNLLENALNYSQNKAVFFKIDNDPDGYRIHILDQGPGIIEDHLKTVFQPFYRLEASRNFETGGSGLGLAIVQQLCKAHGWKIELKNRTDCGLNAILFIPYSV
jgi:two-component system, OmpR family, osmolarity sensor histidine kinase EnvZ